MIPALIPIAVSLASKYVPELIGTALDSKKAEQVAKVVADSAKGHFPDLPLKEALGAYDDMVNKLPEHRAELSSNVLELIKLEVGDVQHAREHTDDKATQRIGLLVMLLNPLYCGCLIGLLAYLSTLSLASGILASLSAVIGAALNQLYQERQQVMNYRFGSSLKDRIKQN